MNFSPAAPDLKGRATVAFSHPRSAREAGAECAHMGGQKGKSKGGAKGRGGGKKPSAAAGGNRGGDKSDPRARRFVRGGDPREFDVAGDERAQRAGVGLVAAPVAAGGGGGFLATAAPLRPALGLSLLSSHAGTRRQSLWQIWDGKSDRRSALLFGGLFGARRWKGLMTLKKNEDSFCRTLYHQ